MTNKAKPYCTCYTEKEIKKKRWLKYKTTMYREVKCSDGDTCDKCGHYVKWMIDFNSILHKHKVRKHKDLKRQRKKYDHEYSETYSCFTNYIHFQYNPREAR